LHFFAYSDRVELIGGYSYLKTLIDNGIISGPEEKNEASESPLDLAKIYSHSDF
jgi:hypothetical protein